MLRLSLSALFGALATMLMDKEALKRAAVIVLVPGGTGLVIAGFLWNRYATTSMKVAVETVQMKTMSMYIRMTH